MGLGQATSTFTTGVFRKVTQVRELRTGHLMEQLAIGWQHLPLKAELIEIMQDGATITGIGVSSLEEVTHDTDSVAKGLFSASDDLDTNKLLKSLDLNLLSWIVFVKINGILVVARTDGHWVTTNVGQGSTVLGVDMVMAFVLAIFLGSRSFHFEDIITDANGDSLDVAPVTNHVGTKVDVKVNLFVSKVLDLCHDKIALSVELKVLIVPGAEMRVAGALGVRSSSGRSGTCRLDDSIFELQRADSILSL
mmetsp:Transcript_24824/g.61048  ORF Transcript_24824/g.61048 Transcript_24824/m.61048 type:complete len:250 (+) Transcript_24824:246-995(+)